MALTALLDTSALTRLGQPVVRRAVEPLARAGTLGRAATSDLEIGFSARDEVEWEALLAARRLRGRKVPDLLIAATAELRGLPVLHYDRDFELIAEVTGQACRWVVARGSLS